MRNYPQDQRDQIPRYVRSRRPQEKGLSYQARVPPNLKSNSSFDQSKWSKPENSDLVPNYEQPALPYYVVPVLYVPQKVLSNEKIVPSNSLQRKNKTLFASYVHQTKQQRRAMLQDYEIPFVTCTVDPQTLPYQRDSPCEVFSDYYPYRRLNKNILDDGDCDDEEEEETTDVEEDEEVEGTISSVSVREEEEEEANVIYDMEPVRQFNSQPTRPYYQNDPKYFYSRPNKSMQILDPDQNYQRKPENCSYTPFMRNNIPPSVRKNPPMFRQSGSINYGGDVYRKQIIGNYPSIHDPFYDSDPFYHHEGDNLVTSKSSNFKPKLTRDKSRELWPPIDQNRVPKPVAEAKPTCEDILRSYMQDKQISLESVLKTSESAVSDGTTSTKKSSASVNTPPCKDQAGIIEDAVTPKTELPPKPENQPSGDLKTTDDTKLASSVQDEANSEPMDSALANFVNSLSETVIPAQTSSEISTLKEIPSGMNYEERELCTITATSEPILDTKSTQTVDLVTAITTSSTSTQTDQKSATPSEKEVDLGKLLGSRESNRTLPDIDIFKPLITPRDLSPSTFFQKFRKQSKPYASIDQAKEKKTKVEVTQQKPASSRLPPKASTSNQSKLKKVKKK